jgi:hypothetical protein
LIKGLIEAKMHKARWVEGVLKHRSGEMISILANAYRPKTHLTATERI